MRQMENGSQVIPFLERRATTRHEAAPSGLVTVSRP